jgi:hypothetical protein
VNKRLNSATFYVFLTILGGGLVFLYQIITARNLEGTSYAKYLAIIGVINILSVSLNSLQKYAAFQVMSGNYIKNNNKIDRLTVSALKLYVFPIMLSLFVLNYFLNLSIEYKYFALIAYHVVFNIISSIMFGKQIAKRESYRYLALGTIMPIGNTVILFVLIKSNRVSLDSIFLSQVIMSSIFLYIFKKFNFENKVHQTVFKYDFILKSLLLILLWTTINLDLVLNSIINQVNSGEYAQIVTLMKTILVIILALSNYYFPDVTEFNKEKYFQIILITLIINIVLAAILNFVIIHFFANLFGGLRSFSITTLLIINSLYLVNSLIIININFIYPIVVMRDILFLTAGLLIFVFFVTPNVESIHDLLLKLLILSIMILVFLKWRCLSSWRKID